jgi:aminoglycoside phosphotransferase (APT) family kinase protein
MPDALKEEILLRLLSVLPEFANGRLGNFSRILGGADTTIHAFDLISQSGVVPMVVRVYRPGSIDHARREYTVMERLHSAGISVPKPYVFVQDSTAIGETYLVMERIDGPLLSDALLASQGTLRFDRLLKEYVKDLAALHALDAGLFVSGLSSSCCQSPLTCPRRAGATEEHHQRAQHH